MNKEIKKYFSDIGTKGGNTTLKKYGKRQMKKWGKLGGRPKILSLNQAEKQLIGDNLVDKPTR